MRRHTRPWQGQREHLLVGNMLHSFRGLHLWRHYFSTTNDFATSWSTREKDLLGHIINQISPNVLLLTAVEHSKVVVIPSKRNFPGWCDVLPHQAVDMLGGSSLPLMGSGGTILGAAVFGHGQGTIVPIYVSIGTTHTAYMVPEHSLLSMRLMSFSIISYCQQICVFATKNQHGALSLRISSLVVGWESQYNIFLAVQGIVCLWKLLLLSLLPAQSTECLNPFVKQTCVQGESFRKQKKSPNNPSC